MQAENDKIAGTSNGTVLTRTGKSWSHWMTVLDDIDATNLSHKEIAQILNQSHALSPWWAQQITIGYEQERGMRQKHEKPDGFEISVSKTIAVPNTELFTSCRDSRRRRKWLADPKLDIKKIVPGKRILAAFNGKKSSLRFEFSELTDSKSRIVVQHGKLSGSEESERMKSYWQEQLSALQRLLEP